MRNRSLPRNSSGFTLIELVISAALMSTILVAAYMCLSAAISTQKMIEPRTEACQSARVAIGILAADLRSACPLSKDFEFLGMHRMLGETEADNLDFATHNYTPRRAHQGDFCEVSFYVEKDSETGQFILWRRRNPMIALDPLSGGTREEIARGLRGVRFEYYDGYDWYDDWGDPDLNKKEKKTTVLAPNLSGMPEAVRITLWFDAGPKKKLVGLEEAAPVEPALAFQTVVRMELAAVSGADLVSGGSSGGEAAEGQNGAAGERGGGK
jgi:prepilin-type N-terminal cleavage/methylation domain-containing protein